MASDAAPGLDLPPNGAAGPLTERLSRAHQVSAELEAIFGEPAAGGRAVAPRAAPQPPVRLAERRARSNPFSVTNVGGVLAAALAGVAIGSMLARAPQFARHPAPAEKPPAHAALTATALPPLQTPQAVDAVLIAPPPMPAAAEPAAAKPRPAAARVHVAHARKTRTTAHACCSYAQVAAADRRLRTSYDAALRRGVPRSAIVSAHARWSSARRRGAHDPVRLIADYHEIAADLDRTASRPRNHATYAARDDRGPFHPRYAAWWR